MSQKNRQAFQILCWFAASTLVCSLAAAQAPPSIAEQLEAQYKLVRLGNDANGNVEVKDGTSLAIRKQGLLALPLANPLNPCASTFVNGNLKPPGMFCQAAVGGLSGIGNRQAGNDPPTVNLAVGQRAYPASIAVDSKRETVRFVVVACDPCSGGAPNNFYKAEVDFRFPKGLLASGDAAQVEDTIGQVFSVDSGDAAASTQDAAPPAAQQASAAPEPRPTVSIQQGQTIAEVEQALGKPAKTLAVATKTIYIYPDLKITFMNGKVTDVQ